MRVSNFASFAFSLPKLVSLLTLILGSVALLPSTGQAQGPENTLVVVNAESSHSLAIANRYIKLRDIPATNVIYLKKIPSEKETWSTKWFKQRVLTPVLDAMKERGIENQIDCVAYSAGFPTRINSQPEIKAYLKQTGKKYAITQHAPWASITSLTYFHRNAFSNTPNFLELDANHFANPRRMKILANPFSGADATKYSTAIRQITAGDYEVATKSLTELTKKHPQQTTVVYSLARCLALNGKKDKAIVALQQVKSLGFAYRSVIAKDAAFIALKSNPAFEDIIDQMEDLPDGLTTTRSFSGQNYWAKNGWANGTQDQGERYLMSSVLAVTGKNQSTLKASLDRLKSSVAADGTAPKGNDYFADHNDPRSRTRKNQFSFAAAELKSLGRSASIGSAIYPKNDSQVIGVTMGSAKPKWPASKSKFLPGAICDNFTSYGAWWEKTGQTQISEFLDAGAAGASGTVYEPYTIAAKIPTARWHAHYARGTTLAESFFQSVSGPFQLLLIGDPLCCPFGKFPEFKVTGLKDGDTITEDFILKLEPQAGSPSIKHFDMFYDGVFLSKVANTNQIKIAIDDISVGYHEIRIVGVSDAPIAKKRSKKIGFTVGKGDVSINLNIENPECILGQSLRAKVVSSAGGRVLIQQNRRTITSVQSGEYFEIPTSELGLGDTALQAVVMLPQNQTILSKPVTVSLIPPTLPQDGQEKVLAAADSSAEFPDFVSLPQALAEPSMMRSTTKLQKGDRPQPPSKAELKKAIASIRELLKDKYKNITPEGRTELLKLLQKTAEESTDKPINHYALLSECVFAASEFNSVDAGWSACDQLESSYQVDELPHIGFIKQIKTKLNPESADELYSKGVGLCEQLIDTDRYTEAGDLAKTLSAAIKKQLPHTKSGISDLVGRTKLLGRKFNQIQDDLEVLASDPSNGLANQNIGEFYCLHKNDFKRGLPYLAKAPASPLSQLAQNELSLKKATTQQQLEIANAWWELSSNKKWQGFRVLAIEHYNNVLPNVTGLTEIKVENRIKEANKRISGGNLVAQLEQFNWRVEWQSGKVWKKLD